MKYFPIKTHILTLLGFLLTFSAFAQEAEGEFENVEVIVNNETAINSDRLEFSPAFYENGIVFISTRVAGSKYKVTDKELGKNIMSIFIARRSEEGELQEPVPFAKGLLSTVHEGPLTFSATNDKMFFTRNNVNEKGKLQKASDGKYKLKIYSADKVGGDDWGNVRDLTFNGDEFNTAHPSISVEGDRLFFASDRPGGLGGMDLYVSYKEGAAWGAPVNLGPEVNTPGHEIFPFIHADGTLYFTSDGRGGAGGLDIFYTVKEGDLWSAPVNFEPLNSSKDDFGMIIDRDKKNGYFSSNRSSSLGEDDIFRFYILGDLRQVPEEEDVAEDFLVMVSDEASGLPIAGADVKSLMLDEFTVAKAITFSEGPVEQDELLLKIPFDESAASGMTNLEGQYTIRLEPGNHIFKILKDGYQTKRVAINTEELEDNIVYVSLKEGSDEEVLDAPNFTIDGGGVLPEKIEEGTVFRLPNIYYNFNDATIRPDAKTDLNYLAEFLLKFPDVEIELASHTDSRGSDDYNLDLSQRRAENAVDYLVSLGVSRDRMVPVGYGETKLRNECEDGVKCSEAKHQFNRRTEVRILRMNDPINLTIVNEVEKPEVIDYPDLQSEAPSTGGSGVGRYQVVAGSFRVEKNAQNRLQTLKDLGYSTAEVVYNPGNSLHVVLVGIFEIKSEAQSLISRLKNDGVECFIKVK